MPQGCVKGGVTLALSKKFHRAKSSPAVVITDDQDIVS